MIEDDGPAMDRGGLAPVVEGCRGNSVAAGTDIEMVKRFVCAAIKERRLVQFRYERTTRVVEPHTYGYCAGGEPMMLGWPVHRDFGEGWQEFRIGSMSGISIIGGDSQAPRWSCPRETSMLRILCQISDPVAIA